MIGQLSCGAWGLVWKDLKRIFVESQGGTVFRRRRRGVLGACYPVVYGFV